MTDFVHLHFHTEYSLLDGVCRISEIMDAVKAAGQTAVAITDHGVMYGAVDFYRAAKKAGIKPIIGCEVYVAPRTRFDKDPQFDTSPYHLVLLAENQTGYKNLIYLVSKGFTEGFYNRPRVDMDLLRERHEGIIACSACISGAVSRRIINRDYESAKNTALEFDGIFGRGNYFLELQDHGEEEEAEANAGLLRISKETGIPLIASNDVHYLAKEDAYVQDVMMCIQTGKTINDTDRMRMHTSELYLKTGDEMAALFPEHPEALENTLKIAERCNVDFTFGTYQLPNYPLPEGVDHYEYLEKLTWEGFKRRFPEDPGKEYHDRIEYELGLIKRMGFVDLYLITQDFLNYAKSNGIPVGPGRGSCAGSLVAYCINITEIDSIKYACYFDRFLNPERVTMPDFDIDFCYIRRQEVIDYVIRRYGADHVSQIVTFGTMAARAAVRDVGRVLGVSYADTDVIAKLVPNELHITLKKALEINPQLKERYDSDEITKRVIDTAIRIEGMPRHASTHAAGMLITAKPVYEYVPLAKNDEAVVAQFDMVTLEELGLLKVDFLGLRNVTVIRDAERMAQRVDPDFRIDDAPSYDPATFAMLGKGKTSGVFQLESAGMTNLTVQIQPKSIEDITAVIALYRPGPMEFIPTYVENARHPDKIKYLTPQLKDILDVTYGCMIYQEQVMETFRKIAGYSLGRADVVRRAMSKKKFDVLISERENFVHGNEELHIDGAVSRGISEEIANELFDQMQDFANYAFNKAHSVCYAIICYQTAYLKCHYPKEYMAALLTSVLGFTEKMVGYIEECKQMGIPVLPPDINQSGAGFTVAGKSIRFGLVALKNIGSGFIDRLVEERERNGDFRSFKDFCERMYGIDLNRRALESLIRSGAFDSFGHKRAQLMAVCDSVLDGIAKDNRTNVEGQLDMFGMMMDENETDEVELPDIPEYSRTQLLSMEKETTGMYMSGHPLDSRVDELQAIHAVSFSAIQRENSRYGDGDYITVAGILTAVKIKTTKAGSMMAYVTIEDLTGSMEMMVFSRQLNEAAGVIKEGNTIMARAQITVKEEEAPKLKCDTIALLDARGFEQKNPVRYQKEAVPQENAVQENARQPKLFVRINDDNEEYIPRMNAILRIFTGTMPVVLFDARTRQETRSEIKVSGELLMKDELSRFMGGENVIIK